MARLESRVHDILRRFQGLQTRRLFHCRQPDTNPNSNAPSSTLTPQASLQRSLSLAVNEAQGWFQHSHLPPR
jgi:hypothetical protein